MEDAIDQIMTDWHEWYAPGRVEPEDVADVIKVLIDCDTKIVREDGNDYIEIEPKDTDVENLLKKINQHHGAPMYLSEKDIETIRHLAGEQKTD